MYIYSIIFKSVMTFLYVNKYLSIYICLICHLHQLKVENCNSNSRFVVGEDDCVNSGWIGLMVYLSLSTLWILILSIYWGHLCIFNHFNAGDLLSSSDSDDTTWSPCWKGWRQEDNKSQKTQDVDAFLNVDPASGSTFKKYCVILPRYSR